MDKKIQNIPQASRYIFFISLVMVCLGVLNGIFLFREVRKIRYNAKVISSAAIIRGSIQRISKLELSGVASDSIMSGVDNILAQFQKKELPRHIHDDVADFSARLNVLIAHWSELKEAVIHLRANPDEATKAHFLELSEQSWEYANNVVLLAQFVSESKVTFLRLVFILTGFIILIPLFVIWYNRKFVKNRLEYMAHYDGLTRILNRYSYEIIIEKETQKAERYAYSLSLLIFDIDYFKHVNDEYGHKKGDYVLWKVAATILGSIRESDIFCRVGGEEFAVIAPGISLTNAEQLAEKLRAAIENSDFEISEGISISLGVAEFRKGDSPDTLFRRADNALYKAKAQGRNRVELQNNSE